MAKLSLQFKNGLMLTAIFADFPENANLDAMLKIDYKNLIAELLTFPVILNRVGFLLAEAENEAKERELDYKIFKAKKRESIRNTYIETKTKFTVDMIDDAMRASGMYLVKNRLWNEAIKKRDYVNSLYWSMKDKSDKLNKLSLTLSQNSLTSAELPSALNGVQIKIQKPLIS